MSRRRVIWFAAALALAAAFMAAPAVREWFAVDTCLDGGGAWIKQARKCSRDQAEIDRYKSAK